MQERSLTCTIRNEFKSGAANRLRKSGKIPAIIYGHQKPLAISVDSREFHTKFKIISENVIISLKVEGNNYDVLVKDYQEDLIKERVTHLDFYEIEKGKTLKAKVPVHIIGTAVGVKVGGIFEFLLHDVEVECLPKDLPEKIDVDITNLELNQSVHIKDLTIAPEVTITNPEQQVVCHVIRKRETVEVAAETEVAAEGEAAEAATDETKADEKDKK